MALRFNTPTSGGTVLSRKAMGTAASVGKQQLRIATTAPDTLLRHDISDEELEMIGGVKRDGFAEFMWAMVSLAVGAAPAGIEAIYKSYLAATPAPLSALGLVQVILMVAGIVLALATGVAIRRRGKPVADLVEAIRARAAS